MRRAARRTLLLLALVFSDRSSTEQPLQPLTTQTEAALDYLPCQPLSTLIVILPPGMAKQFRIRGTNFAQEKDGLVR